MMDLHGYCEANKLQKTFARETILEYSPQMSWRSDGKDTVLDIGCANGGVTEDVLASLLPKGYKKIMGIDINKQFIEIAQKRNKNERIMYKTMDIVDDAVLNLGKFDHITSFLCLHWVDDKRKAFENIYNLLEEGGDCVLVLGTNHNCVKGVKIMSLMDQWKHCFEDRNLEVGPFRLEVDPVENLRNIFKDLPFKHYKIESKRWDYDHGDMKTYRNFMKSFNAIGNRLSEEEYERYIDDILEVTWTMDNDPSRSTITRGDYQMIYAHK